MLEEINTCNHHLLDQVIILFKKWLKPWQVSTKNEFVYALTHRRKWFPDNYHLLAIHEGDQVLAGGAGYYIGDINAGFINYIVTAENCRGRGFGEIIRNRLLELFVNDAKQNNFSNPIGYLGEVEKENPWLNVLIRKYGVLPLEIKYLQPPLKGKRKATPLVLYFQPHQNSSIQIEKEFTERVVHAIYTDVYGIAKVNKNPHFIKTMESLK